MGLLVRKVTTRSGAVAVQIAHTERGVQTIVEHLGSAHDEVELAVLVRAAKSKIQGNQLTLDFAGLPAVPAETPVVVGSRSRVLVQVVNDAYDRLGFDVVGDEVFRLLVLARLVEPVSKADSIRVLTELGVRPPGLRTIWRTLARCQEHDWRGLLAAAAHDHATAVTGPLRLVMYDCTTLYFEAEYEDKLRKVGMSKERRVDPQVLVGLLVTATGFPLAVHCFEGNKAETKTLVPVLQAYQDRHGVTDLVVVADAGMFSAANLNAIEDAGLSFIVGSRISKAPYDLEAHFDRWGTNIPDGQTIETTRVMGQGSAARQRRIVYHYDFRRARRDNQTLNKQVERAEKIIDGRAPLKRDRFVKLTGTTKEVNTALIDRARELAGLKGYVTNIGPDTLDGTSVVKAYHDLYKVEKSFRMAKTDLRARPMFHHRHDSIEAHLTIVFAALAIAHHLQDTTGVSIKKITQTLRPLRDVTINIEAPQV